MALAPGTRLGPYEILSALGAGGMGEVYKARDTRLTRTVAIKVLPADTATDLSARTRFEREARAIATLSHPHICVVYDVGSQGDTDYLVMELLEGETLAERLVKTKGPLPLDQVLTIGVAIADALDRAHRAGIVHRDLKPANVMLTKSGPKLLDFGLAKLHQANSPVSISNATAATTAGPGTAKGTILGTIHYMAPEQVEGREADTRSDIWALGAVLYEMATGQRPFDGESAASIIGAILKDTPPALSTRRPLTPPAFKHLVERCLEKEPDERWQSIRDVKRELQWVAAAPPATVAAALPSSAMHGHPMLPWAIAAVATTLAAGSLCLALRPVATPAAGVRTVLSIVPPDGVRVVGASALSPDGRHFAFVGLGREGAPALWLRLMDTGASRSLPGTDDASYPFWSPSSDAIGFFAEGKLKTLALTGAAPRVLATAQSGRGGSWGADGTILYCPDSQSAVYRIADKGGSPVAVSTVDVAQTVSGHRWPAFVDSQHFIYTTQAARPEATGIYLATFGSEAPPTRLSPSYSNTIMAGSHLLFVKDEALLAQRLDVKTGQLAGEPVELNASVAWTAGIGFASLSATEGGMLAYSAGSSATTTVHVRLLDRRGQPGGIVGAGTELAQYNSYGERLSPDGRVLAITAFPRATSDLWLLDLVRGVASRFTVDGGNYATWSPSGSEIVFASNRGGPFSLYRKSVASNSEQRLLAKSPFSQYPSDWSADGRTLVFTSVNPTTQADIWTIPASGDAAPAPFLAGSANEYSGRLSPDGRWIAYTSDESGHAEVYVQRFPTGGDKIQLSTQGGMEPTWRGDGRELFYVASNRTIVSVPISITASLEAGRPAKVFDQIVDTSLGPLVATHYTVSADGQRFYVNVGADVAAPTMVVMNWPVALAK